jgi:hypothetical protein
MLRRAAGPGLCINCAAHDWLRNTYPANLLLAQSGPKSLAFPHIQEQFAGLMKMANSDARPDEINWQRIIDNWELPFPNKVRARAENPADQEELDRERKKGPFREAALKGEFDNRSMEQIFEDIDKRAKTFFKKEVLPLLQKDDPEPEQ